MEQIKIEKADLPEFYKYLSSPGVEVLSDKEVNGKRIIQTNTNQEFILPKYEIQHIKSKVVSAYDNDLIFGANRTENIVSLEDKEDRIIVYREVNGKIIEEDWGAAGYWLLTKEKANKEQKMLAGYQNYKWLAEFDTLKEKNEARFKLKRFNKDFYDIYDPKEAFMTRHGVTYYKGLTPKEISILSFDIETNGLTKDGKSLAFLISNTLRFRGQIVKVLFSIDDFGGSQIKMINTWCDWVRSKDPSIICGHNIFGFDLPFLDHVMKLNGLELLLGRDDSPIKFNNYPSKYRKDESQEYEYFDARIFGRELVDTMFLSIKYDIGRKYESYGLKSIIKQEGLEKEGRVFIDAGKIAELWLKPNTRQMVKEYALDDSDDSLKLFDLMAPSFFYFAQSVSKTFQRIINSNTGSWINNIMVRSYLQVNHSIAKADEAGNFEGAISFGIPGIYKNVYKVDVASLYPSIMRQYQIYNAKKDPDKNFLKVVEYFTVERLKNKKTSKETGDQYYKDLEQSQKIGINSAYGFLGTNGLNYNYPYGAAAVTRIGREILSKGVEFATGKTIDYWKSKLGNEEEENETE